MSRCSIYPPVIGAMAAPRVSGHAAGFLCVYLTSSIRTAEMASTLLSSAQILIHHSATLTDAKARLLATQSRVLLTDISFEGGGWEDALRMAARLPRPTALVLVSRLADERFWIEALELGAYDLILEPFRADARLSRSSRPFPPRPI